MGTPNPRKFAEKIALLRQKEREQSEQFNNIIQEVNETMRGGVSTACSSFGFAAAFDLSLI